MNEVICFHCHAWFLENSHSHNSGNSFNFLHRANVIVTISSSSRIMYLLLWAFYLFLPASHKLETAWSSSPSSLDWSQLQSHMKESEDIISTFYIPIITGNLFFVFWCLVLLYCLQRCTGRLGKDCCLWSDYVPAEGWQSASAHKSCSLHYLLPDDFVNHTQYMAQSTVTLVSLVFSCFPMQSPPSSTSQTQTQACIASSLICWNLVYDQ